MKKLAIAVALVLAGCASQQDASLSAPAAPPLPVTVAAPKAACVKNRTWTAAELDSLAAIMATFPAGAILWTMEMDWQSMRDGNDACAEPAR